MLGIQVRRLRACGVSESFAYSNSVYVRVRIFLFCFAISIAASRYQLAHSIALVIVGHMMASGHTHIGPAANAFAAGIAGFSGSIYLLSLGIGPRGVLGPVTPLGGLLLIAGWGLLALRAGKR